MAYLHERWRGTNISVLHCYFDVTFATGACRRYGLFMELRQLRYFVRIVELGSLTRAAKDLYIAQPALSAQISKLENELDIKLLTRSVRGVMPTEAGESLY